MISAASGGRYQLVEAGRGMGSLAVLLYHSLAAQPPADHARLHQLTGWGWLGVHMFFAISGWCIAERFARARARRETAAAFLRERILRIYPTYWAALAVSLGLRLLAVPFNHTTTAENLPAGFAGWAGTLLLIEPYLGLGPYLTVSWSLVYEVGFYLLAAAALLGSRWIPLGGRRLFGLGVGLCVVPWVSGGHPGWFVIGLWPDFFAGVAAWYAAGRGERALGLGVLATLAVVTVSGSHGSEAAGRLAAIATAVALYALRPWDAVLSASRPVRFLLWAGALSYSLYLIHVPLISPWMNLLGRFTPSSSPLFPLVWLSALLLALGGGWLLHRHVEAPLQSWRKHRPCPAS
ncbi:MAG: acyltransferase [Verrucomicrobia bacterium]|nr:acyltransferase [Verrucomicrobiota bacterium]